MRTVAVTILSYLLTPLVDSFSIDTTKKSSWIQTVVGSIAAQWAVAPMIALAVSGGGLDYAGLDISNQDFSNNNYKSKDFTQVLAKATSFRNSNLQGCRFYKA